MQRGNLNHVQVISQSNYLGHWGRSKGHCEATKVEVDLLDYVAVYPRWWGLIISFMLSSYKWSQRRCVRGTRKLHCPAPNGDVILFDFELTFRNENAWADSIHSCFWSRPRRVCHLSERTCVMSHASSDLKARGTKIQWFHFILRGGINNTSSLNRVGINVYVIKAGELIRRRGRAWGWGWTLSWRWQIENGRSTPAVRRFQWVFKLVVGSQIWSVGWPFSCALLAK